MLSAMQHPIPDIERITKRFQEHFTRERATFLTAIQGFTTASESERYTSLLLNRLMFLYFLQHKGLLDGDINYLSTRLRIVQERFGKDHFYRRFLLPLFHQRPNNSQQHLSELHTLLGNVHYIDEHLFTAHELEHHHPTIQIPDAAFTQLFSFFDTYRWHLDEHTQCHSHEINPRILGYLFEKYINQQQMGAYYTKEDVTEYIAANTIIPYLFDAAAFSAESSLWQLLQAFPDRYIREPIRSEAHLPAETTEEYEARRILSTELQTKLRNGELHSIDDCITYNLDIRQFAQDVLHHIENPALLYKFYDHIRHITILDPTCGSGAFLFAALNILVPLYEICIEHMQAMSSQHDTLHNDFRTILAQVQQYPNLRYFILKSIITNNLYGVDIMEEATEICKLRLFLKLITPVTHIADIEPLPSLDHNIHTGNALIGFITPPQTAHSPTNPEDPPYSTLSRLALDHLLAKQYGIDTNNLLAIQQWQTHYQPFHWCREFAEILQKGGFHIIIGNPPYVEYNNKKFPYTLRNFATLSCGNLYPCVIEQSHRLLSPTGRHGMILPLAAFATKNMTPLIENFQHWFPFSWLSFYHFRPSMLFSGGKVASIPTAIYLVKAQGPEQRFSTHLTKWPTECRNILFSTLRYSQITSTRDPDNGHYYPKFGHPLENTIMEKVLRHPRVSRYLTDTPNQNTMFYRSAGGLYWKVFINFPWPYKTTSNKHCTFQEGYDRDVFVALYNSSLFWWYYTVTFDTFNLKDYMLFGFRFSYPQETGVINTLQYHSQRLMDDFQRHAEHKKRGTTNSYTIYARKSKAIIDDIDHILAEHYELTNEELHFILNYDLKYRIGQKQSDEEASH